MQVDFLFLTIKEIKWKAVEQSRSETWKIFPNATSLTPVRNQYNAHCCIIVRTHCKSSSQHYDCKVNLLNNLKTRPFFFLPLFNFLFNLQSLHFVSHRASFGIQKTLVSVHIRSFYYVNLRIQSECEKLRTIKPQ